MPKGNEKEKGEEAMEERFQVIENYLLVRMPEEIDHHAAAKISERADAYMIQEKIDHIVFDFEDTRFMDSSGIGIVMGRYKKLSCFGGKVFAIHLNHQMERIVAVSGLYKIMDVLE